MRKLLYGIVIVLKNFKDNIFVMWMDKSGYGRLFSVLSLLGIDRLGGDGD
ncbi:hypothetical protein [Polluticaenibacter yanchengensis]|uniref:Uncharacterized protein n=1 Tax=Polluticaenibacter yanchengensis TaxID=3014562 RepID=A0ABT4UIF4_9BACT|nr:hypothetical protein [Chitinophagaceae bacterium LY-5]